MSGCRFKKYIIYVIIIAIISLCGCVKNNYEIIDSQTQNDDIEKDILYFRITWKAYSGRGEAIKKIVDTFNELNEINYKVEIVDGDEDLPTIEALFSGTDTTVSSSENLTIDTSIYMLPYRYVQYLGNQNMLDDLTSDFVDEKVYFYKNLWKLGVVKDTVYGIPWMGHTMALIYNKNLLAKAEVDPETITNLNELTKACDQVIAKTEAMGIGLVGAEHNDISWMVNQFIYGFGGSLVSEDGQKVTVNSAQSIAAIDFYKNVLGPYAQTSWKEDTGVEVMDAFRNQSIAFEIQGLWGVTDIWKSGDPFETGIIPLEDIGIYSEVGPMMLAVPNNLSEEKRTAVVSFIRYMISTKAQEMIMDGEYSPEHDAYYPFRLPVRSDITESKVFDEYPEFADFISGFNMPSIDVPVPLWQQIKDEYYEPGLHRVMVDELTIEEFLKSIEESGNQILGNQ